jgi:hypothetical protein
MTEAGGGGVFVSYRRQESSHLAGRLYDRLAGRFGEDQVFMDVDTIEPGVDFAEEILQAVAACKVLLAIIGPTWLTAADARGRRRLDDPDDIVRLEVEAALARNVRVVPILIDGAIMPTRSDLPESLAGLARRNALPIRHDSFRSDAGRLITAIERILAAPAAMEASGPHGVRLAANLASEEAPEDSGPARDNAARAARLFEDAERIATSITNESSKASALSGIAQAVAAIDPDRAGCIVASITDEYYKAVALSGIAQVLATKSP